MRSYGSLAYGAMPAEYDQSTPDPFVALLENPEAQLIYLLELYPYDETLPQTLTGIPPYGAAPFGGFSVNFAGGLKKVYLSDAGFVTEPEDNPSSVYFAAHVDNPLQFETSILTGDSFSGANQSYGALTIYNGDGGLDFLQDYYWSNRRVVIKAGDRTFRYADFATVFDGAVNDIESDDDQITMTIRDNRVKTDQLIQPGIYAGTGGLEGGNDLANKPKPLCYGLVNNIEPVLVDAANLIYQVHNGSIGFVSAVRDSGATLINQGDVSDIMATTVSAGNFKTQLSGGYIKLGSTPAGRITADVLGENGNGGYVSTVPNIILRLLKTRLGVNSFADTEIDGGSVNRLGNTLSGTVGIYITERTTGSAVIEQLLSPFSAYWTFTRQGQLFLGAVGEVGTETATITEDMIDDAGIKIINTIAPSWRISVGYAPSWVVQSEDELVATTSTLDRAFVTQDYRYVTFEDSGVRAKNQKAIERVFQTNLTEKTDAETLLLRLKTIFSINRRVYQVTIYRGLFRLFLGDIVKLIYNRFGLEEGKGLLVVGIAEDVETGRTTLSLWG